MENEVLFHQCSLFSFVGECSRWRLNSLKNFFLHFFGSDCYSLSEFLLQRILLLTSVAFLVVKGRLRSYSVDSEDWGDPIGANGARLPRLPSLASGSGGCGGGVVFSRLLLFAFSFSLALAFTSLIIIIIVWHHNPSSPSSPSSPLSSPSRPI